MRIVIATAVLAGSVGLLAQPRKALEVALPTVMVPAAMTVCDAHAVAQRIARAGGVPLGFEALAACYAATHPPAVSGSWNFERKLRPVGEDTLSLEGKSIREAFEWLVDQAPQYSWREINGIPVVRPEAAWTESTNALNARADALAGEVRLEDALNLVLLREVRGGSANQFGRRQVALTFRGGTIAEALSAIAAADGARGWDAVMVQRPTLFHRTTPVLIVGLRTSNPNAGGGAAYLLDPAKLIAQ